MKPLSVLQSVWVKRKRLAIGLALVCLLALGFTINWSVKSKSNVAEDIKEVLVEKGDLKIVVEADGKVELSTVNLGFQIDGVVQEIPVKAGANVKRGDVIASLDSEKYKLEVNMAKSNYEASLAELNQAREDYQQKLITAEQRLSTLRREYKPMVEAPEVFPAQEIALKKLAIEYEDKLYKETQSANSDIKLEEANLAESLGNLKKAERDLQDTVLTSPVNGRLLSLSGEVGETVSKEKETIFAVISQNEAVYVTANILELDIANIFPGQSVEVKFEAIPGEIFTGTVTEIDMLPVDDPNGIVAYNTTVKLENKSEKIKNGMTCVASFIIEQKKNVLVIPNQAVKRLNGVQVIEKLTPDSKTITQRVITGFTDGRNVEVIEGLKPSDKVIIRTMSSAKQGEIK